MSLNGWRASTTLCNDLTYYRCLCSTADRLVKLHQHDPRRCTPQLCKNTTRRYGSLTLVKPQTSPFFHLRKSSATRNFSDALARCKPSFNIPKATHSVEALTVEDIGQEVVLHGYLGSRADTSSKLSFVPLLSRDLSTSIQIVSSAANSTGQEGTNHHAKLKNIASHSPVVVRGTVKSKQKPKNKSTSRTVARHEQIEVSLVDVEAFNDFPSNVTFEQDTVIAPEQRHLQLRHNAELRHALRFRARVANHCREFLNKNDAGFVELETPLLFKSTPEGAREFIVPTRRKGLVYALPQSPQQYKQILMASGFPAYFQFARCFRDEDLRADRQPEFTQLDLEMGFAGSDQVMECVEQLVRQVWKETLSEQLSPDPFPRLTYEEVMSRYGSDKPDPRLGMQIMRIDHMIPADLISKVGPLSDPIVEAFKLDLSVEPQSSRQFIQEFMSSAESKPFVDNPDGQPGIFIYDSRKPLGGLQPFGFEAAEQLEERLQLEEGNVVVIQARQKLPFSGGSTPIGNLRLALHTAAVSSSLLSTPKGWNLLWVKGFPMFSPSTGEEPGQGGSAGLACTHHPFTAPASTQDLDLLATAPLEARADHFDLVLNGVELGGGSRRIHSPELQEYVLRDVLKMDDEGIKGFVHLLDVLKSGCPPHAGFALGLDRLCAVMFGKDSIRDVIAFPKSGRGEDMLVKSPGKITQEQLDTYHLQLK